MANIQWKTLEESLVELKETKRKELSNACKEAIVDGFVCVVRGKGYWFSYDAEAQVNLVDFGDLFNTQETVLWTVTIDDVYQRIELNLEEFKFVKMNGINHKMECISEYRDVLCPLVEAATEIEEVNKIEW